MGAGRTCAVGAPSGYRCYGLLESAGNIILGGVTFMEVASANHKTTGVLLVEARIAGAESSVIDADCRASGSARPATRAPPIRWGATER
eukprot:6062664-Heterocapsa_arctica.AAC.1